MQRGAHNLIVQKADLPPRTVPGEDGLPRRVDSRPAGGSASHIREPLGVQGDSGVRSPEDSSGQSLPSSRLRISGPQFTDSVSAVHNCSHGR